jgi:hypothetical protein
MKNLGRVCVISFFVLGVSALGAASPGMTEVSDAGIVETAKPSPAPSTQDRPGTGGQSPSGNPLWGIPIKQLSATRDRPIFSPSRRPPPPVIVDQPVVAAAPIVQKPREPDRPQLSLLGTIVNGDNGIGIFMDQTTKAPVRIRIGAAYEGWTLRLLQPGSVTLVKGPESAVLVFPKPANNGVAVAGPLMTAPVMATPAVKIAPPAARKARHPGLTAQTPTSNSSPQSTSVRAQARIFGAFGDPAQQQ